MSYWHMQLHPNNINWGKENEILSRNIIGIGDWNNNKSTAQIKDLKSMKDGDIVLVKRGETPLALVKIVGDFNLKQDQGKGIGGNEWIYYKRNVSILNNLLENTENRDKVPQPRGTLQKLVNRNTKTYKYIDDWYKEILDDKENNKIIDIQEYQENFTISMEELKTKLNKVDNIKHIDILNFYKKSIKDIETINIEIENLKSIKKLNEKFTIKLDNGLYTIVGNNGIGKSALLISLGHLIKHTFLQTEFKGDSFDDSKITYSFNNLVKFEWKKYNQKDQSKNWTIQNKKFDMPRIEGFFESGIVTGNRFENLNFKNEILELVEKSKITDKQDQEKENIQFIRDNLNYIINDNNKIHKYSSLFTFSKNRDSQTHYFYKDENNKVISEFSFSTGEYFVLALLKLIVLTRNKRKKLIIIDEIDISLHPLAQHRLVEKLRAFAKPNKNNITFLIATHSLPIIDETKGKNIFYIENYKGEISFTQNKKPGLISSYLYNKVIFDKVILVEDNLAKKFIEQVVDEKILNDVLYTIIPIGGWEKVLEILYLNKNDKFLGENVQVILDGDVENSSDYTTHKYNNLYCLFLPIQNVEKYIVKISIVNNNFQNKIKTKYLKGRNFNNLNLQNNEKYRYDLKEKFKYIQPTTKENLIRDFKKFIEDLIKYENNPEDLIVAHMPTSEIKAIYKNLKKEIQEYSSQELSESELDNFLIKTIIDDLKEDNKYTEFKQKIEGFLKK